MAKEKRDIVVESMKEQVDVKAELKKLINKMMDECESDIHDVAKNLGVAEYISFEHEKTDAKNFRMFWTAMGIIKEEIQHICLGDVR